MNLNVDVVLVTNENRKTHHSSLLNVLNSEGCGICEKKGAEVFWFSPYSRCAHAKCVKQIEAAESTLIKKIDSLFKKDNYGEQNISHIRAIKAVRKACGSETILSYMEKNGVEALKNLFDTVGVEAAQTSPSRL